MRLFQTFTEARSEIKRDLREMGIKVENTHMQDKVGSFPTLELNNYGYTVLEPKYDDLAPRVHYVDAEWQDRLEGILGSPINPGRSWKYREELWFDFLEHAGKPREAQLAIPKDYERPLFAYTYGERFALNQQVLRVVRELRNNPESRQLYISLWDPDVDSERLGIRRVPCSLGWHLLFRENKLHMTYTMRSCDFFTHWENDCWMSLRLLNWIAWAADKEAGRFSQFINSFHVYEKDVQDVF